MNSINRVIVYCISQNSILVYRDVAIYYLLSRRGQLICVASHLEDIVCCIIYRLAQLGLQQSLISLCHRRLQSAWASVS